MILAYGLFIAKYGFYGDEWYLAYAGKVEGASKFTDVFASDRPFRAYLVGFMYQLIGLNAPLHGYVSLFIRYLGGLGTFWLFFQLFPRQKWLSLFLAALFVVYPGFLQQPVGFDYQSHHMAITLEVFSIAMMVAAWKSSRIRVKAPLIVFSAAFSLVNFLLMEYYLGLEGFRIAVLLYLASGGGSIKSVWVKPRLGLKKAVFYWLPYLASSALFLIWRLMIFTGTRSQTNVAKIAGEFFATFFSSSVSFLVDLARSFVNLTATAWFAPLYIRANDLRLKDAILAIAVGLLAAGITYVVWRWVSEDGEEYENQEDDHTVAWLFWMGVACSVSSLVFVVFGERAVNFAMFNRFTYPGSIGAVMIIGALVALVRSMPIRGLLISVLIGLSVVSNVANSLQYLEIWDSVKDFWWQVSWRIPQIKPESMLVVNYAAAPVSEDFYVWGPADLIYFPESYKPQGVTRSPLGSVAITNENIQAIQLGRELPDRIRRGIYLTQDMREPLVISQPRTDACVHVLDGSFPEISQFEDPSIQLVARQASIKRIDLDAISHIPPVEIFGSEPIHDWCYYYQKASLARQQGNWQEVARLGMEATTLKLHPVDRVEWLPFLQAFAYTGDFQSVRDLYPIISEEPFLKYQVCQNFSRSANNLKPREETGRLFLVSMFCP